MIGDGDGNFDDIDIDYIENAGSDDDDCRPEIRQLCQGSENGLRHAQYDKVGWDQICETIVRIIFDDDDL